MTRTSMLLLLGLAGVCLAACEQEDDCSPGQFQYYGVCLETELYGGLVGLGGSAGSSGVGAAGGAGGADPAAGGARPGSGAFGDVCSDHPQCGDPSPYCVKQPGADEGYCTITGCLVDGSICPDDWYCRDFTAFPGGVDFCSPNN